MEVSAQEAVYLLLQLPLRRSSRQIVFVNTNPPEQRVYLLKLNIDQLPDDVEVAENNLLSRYFQSHLEHFESVKQVLSQKITFYEPYATEVIVAQDLLETADNQQWDMSVPGVEQREACSAAAGTTESKPHAAIDPAGHGQTAEYDLAVDLGLSHISSDATPSRYDMSDADYFSLMKSLNREQLEFVYDTVHHLKISEQPLYRFLSGGAGTGKSYVLRALREMSERYFKSRCGENFQQHWSITLAPTGKAAYIAGGATIHSILHVPANQSLIYHRLDHQTLNTLRSQIGHIVA